MSYSSSSRNTHTTIMGLAKIMRLAFGGDNLAELTESLVGRIQSNASDAAAMLDLSVVLQLNAQPQLALELQSQALQLQRIYSLKSNPNHPRLRLLAIMGRGEVMANTPLEFLIEDSDIALQILYVGEGVPASLDIPNHDVAFVAPCEFDQNQPLLRQLEQVMRYWPSPFVNLPSSIAELSRDRVAEKLSGASNIVASRAFRLSREACQDFLTGRRDEFPFIVRPVNSHAGQGLEKIGSVTEFLQYVNREPHAEYFLAPFIDYRSRDGWYRKYRVAVIDGRPFAAHMAISQHWMVHYLNADMLGNEKNRQEEAKFMQSFDSEFAIRHRSALQQIDTLMKLDYYSIDCAETQEGKLLVFEVDSGAVVHSMDPIDVFPYKLPQMKQVFAAFRTMLFNRSQLLKRKTA